MYIFFFNEKWHVYGYYHSSFLRLIRRRFGAGVSSKWGWYPHNSASRANILVCCNSSNSSLSNCFNNETIAVHSCSSRSISSSSMGGCLWPTLFPNDDAMVEMMLRTQCVEQVSMGTMRVYSSCYVATGRSVWVCGYTSLPVPVLQCGSSASGRLRICMYIYPCSSEIPPALCHCATVYCRSVWLMKGDQFVYA